jgi:uncharacterized repeat protein (TIGR01451 family)
VGMSWTGPGRRTRLIWLVGSLVVALACAMVFVGVAEGARKTTKKRNWPNSPIRHTLRQTALSTTPSFSANLRGDVAVAGNTLETCPENLASARTHGAKRRPRARTSAEACLGLDNNEHNMVYVNADPGGGRFNSSTATLTVPAGARVARAFLYWAGDLSRGVQRPPNDENNDAPAGNTPQTNPLYTTALLRAGSGGSYATIDATAPDRNGRWDYIQSWYQQVGTSPGWAYQVRADVTAELNNALTTQARRTRSGDESLPVTVADVQAGTGYNRYAGWNLIVVWTTPTAAWRNITLFDGFDWVQVQGGESLVVGPLDFTGFQTPASGNVNARVTVWATEGDRAITGDYMSLGDLSPTCDGLQHESDAARPAGNFFNSSISSGGVSVGGRTPNYDNQLGFDLGTLNVPEGTIHNGATGASVCLGTVGDTYFFGGLVFDTLIRAPNLEISKTADHTNANPGDVVTYTTAVTNPATRDPSDPLFGTPVDAATNLVTADPLPSGLDFVGFTVNPPTTGHPAGACTYSDATRTISCAVGTLDPDAHFTYSYEARVDATAQGDSPAPLVNPACYESNSEDQPAVLYTGCDQASVVVPPAPPPAADLGVVKTVDHNIVAPGDTLTWTIVGTNHGPATSTGFVLADQLPAGVAFVSATHSSALTCTAPPVGAGGAITCTAPSVPAAPAAGSSLTLTIVATVPATTANGTLLLNIATVNGDQTEPTPDPHPNRDQTLTRVLVPDMPIPPIPPSPPPLPPDPNGPLEPPAPPVHPPTLPPGPAGTRIALHKTATPRVARAGQTIAYALRLSNIGDAAALHVRVCDTPPAGLTVISAPGFHRSGRAICTTMSRLNTQRHRTFRLRARVHSRTRGRTVNHATATARNAPRARSKAATVVVAPPPPPLVTG